MQKRSLASIFTILITATVALGQTSWLDRPLNNDWNNASGLVPAAPRASGDPAATTRCREAIRNPESLADRAVTRAGWSLFGASQTYGAVTVVNGLASFDGMCRPLQYNTFVFVSNRFAGTLSPTVMDSRTDGALDESRLLNAQTISADFSRYTSSDALCCPSQTSTVNYTVTGGTRGIVKASGVDTTATCANEGSMETQDNVISGTVTYRQRSSLPVNAVVTVKMVDVSRQDVSGAVIAEQRIEAAGKQVPFSFDMAYDRSKIREQNRYAIQAQITDGERLLFITDTSYPVLTQGNPRTVEVVVVPVRGGGGGPGGNRDRTISGTVTYRERIALASNSIVVVRLIDTAAAANSAPLAEMTINTTGRQVPIPFEWNVEGGRLGQRNFALEAEIKTDGKTVFKTESPVPVTLRGPQATSNIELILVKAGPDAITGKTISLSKFGTGSMRIGDRSTDFLIRASVAVNTNGEAEVTFSRLDGSIPFSGKLTHFDDTTLRIIVENSGDADASGEIEVKYSGRRISSITAMNLVLDGQNVTVRF